MLQVTTGLEVDYTTHLTNWVRKNKHASIIMPTRQRQPHLGVGALGGFSNHKIEEQNNCIILLIIHDINTKTNDNL